MHLWQRITNLLTPRNALIGLTIISVAALLTYIFWTRNRTASTGRSPRFIIVIALFSLGLALCCSYSLLFEPCATNASLFGFLLNPFVRFLLNVLTILLVILLIAVVTLGILDPWRIEVTAKLFGAEFSFKKMTDEGVASLAPELAAKVALALEYDCRSAVIDGTGIAICRGKDGNGGGVILEGLDDYEVSPAEAAAAGILLAAMLCGAT